MRIGIIGSGRIGSTAARRFAEAGHQVAIANSRGPESLRELVAELGDRVSGTTVEDAASSAEVVLIAIPLRALRTLPAAPFAGRTVIDANNYYPDRDGEFDALAAGAQGSSELLAEHLAGARVVKAFNTMHFETLGNQGRTDAPRDERLAIFLAGDDPQAKRAVAGLIEDIGFAPVDTGSLAEGGRRQQPGSPIYNQPMTAGQAEEAIR